MPAILRTNPRSSWKIEVVRFACRNRGHSTHFACAGVANWGYVPDVPRAPNRPAKVPMRAVVAAAPPRLSSVSP
jgi:hypothetical protein